MNRRYFIAASGKMLGYAVAFRVSSRSWLIQAQTPHGPERSMLLAQVEGPRVQLDPRSAGIYAFPGLYALAAQSGSVSGEEANRIVQNGGDFSRSALMREIEFFRLENPEQYAHPFGVGLQVAAA